MVANNQGEAVVSSSSEPLVAFSLPDVKNSKFNGWGPKVDGEEEEGFIRVALFSRSEKISRVADWTVSAEHQNNAGGDSYRRGVDFGGRGGRNAVNHQANVGGIDSAFNFGDDREEDASFNLVDRSSSQKRPNFRRNRFTRPMNMSGRGMYSYNYNRNNAVVSGNIQQHFKRDDRRFGGNQKRRTAWNERVVKAKERSITIDPRWVEIDNVVLDLTKKGTGLKSGVPVDLHISGSIYSYDVKYDKATPKKDAMELKAPDAPEIIDSPIRDDVYISKIASDYPDKYVIFTSDTVISFLMCTALSSAQPWDLVMEKNANIIYLDKRVNGPVDKIVVNEFSTFPPQVENQDVTTPNSPAFLSAEAVFCARVLSFLAQDKSRSLINFSEPAVFKPHKEHPGESSLNNGNIYENNSENVQSTRASPGYCYKYRKWSLGNDILLICRFKIDLINASESSVPNESNSLPSNPSQLENKLKFINIKVFNECDHKALPSLAGEVEPWMKSIESNFGLVLNKEIKNNQTRFNRWIVESRFAGVDTIKLAFISRLNPKLYTKPLLLFMHTINPANYGFDYNDSLCQDLWNILGKLIDCIKAGLPDGTSVIVKDHSAALAKFYQCSPKKINTDEDEAEIDIVVKDDDAP